MSFLRLLAKAVSEKGQFSRLGHEPKAAAAASSSSSRDNNGLKFQGQTR